MENIHIQTTNSKKSLVFYHQFFRGQIRSILQNSQRREHVKAILLIGLFESCRSMRNAFNTLSFLFVFVLLRPVYVVFVFSFALVIVRLWLQQQIKTETVRHFSRNKYCIIILEKRLLIATNFLYHR